MNKTAIILGATGLIGSLILQQLLEDDRYKTIKLFNRNSCGIQHPKIEEYIIDLFELKTYKNEFIADEVFCTIGTTKAKTADKDIYFKIDCGIPADAALLSKENNINTFVVISALGADKNSPVFYNKTKGLMEEKVLEQNIKNTYILQPSLIGGHRTEKRPGEYLAKKIVNIINPLFIGKLKKYRSILPGTITKTMVWLANNNYESGRILSDKIQNISDNI